nr:hypothetical protein [Bacilli bacterium]
MFLKELEAVILPWWLLAVLLTGDAGAWHYPLLIAALYIVFTEIRYRMAVQESRSTGFQRMMRMPIAPWLLRAVLWRRMTIPRGMKCYTIHVHGAPESAKGFVRELRADMAVANREQAVYVGNTFYDLGEWAVRQLGQERVQITDGALFGRWLQTWKAPDELWRIIIINT